MYDQGFTTAVCVHTVGLYCASNVYPCFFGSHCCVVVCVHGLSTSACVRTVAMYCVIKGLSLHCVFTFLPCSVC